MPLQLEGKYLQRVVPGVGTLMGLVEEALREKFFPALFRGEEINANCQKILGHSIKHDGLGILDPRLSVDIAYNTSKLASREQVDSLLRGSSLKYVGHRVCVRRASLSERREKIHVNLGDMD